MAKEIHIHTNFFVKNEVFDKTSDEIPIQINIEKWNERLEWDHLWKFIYFGKGLSKYEQKFFV